MKKYLHISENSVTYKKLADKGLNNDLYNYKGGVFPIGENTAFFLFILGRAHGRPLEREA